MKQQLADHAARLYSHMFYVKSWVHSRGHLPIRKVRPVYMRDRSAKQREARLGTKQLRVIHNQPRAACDGPVPKGWTAGFQVQLVGETQQHLIEAKELAVPRLPTGNKAGFDSRCPHKLQRNLDWLSLCLKNPRGARQAIVLDGLSMKTSTLSHWSHGFERLHVPNFDTAFTEQLRVTPPQNVRVYPMSLYQLLVSHEHPADGYDLALDYCASFRGNQENVLPQADLTYIFSHGLLARKNGVLWLTFSTRAKAIDTCMEVKTFLQRLAEQTAYTLKLCSSGTYFNTDSKATMAYFFYST